MDWAGLYDNCSFEAKKMIAAQFVKAFGSSEAMRWTLNLMFPLRNFRPFIWSRRVRKIGAPGLLLISPLWRNPGRLVENTPHLQDNRHFLFYPVSFPANKLHNKILFAKSALFGTPPVMVESPVPPPQTVSSEIRLFSLIWIKMSPVTSLLYPPP